MLGIYFYVRLSFYIISNSDKEIIEPQIVEYQYLLGLNNIPE